MASSLKIESLLGLLTIRLNDISNGAISSKICFKDEECVTSEITEAYKAWLCTDKALLSLLIAFLSDEAIEYVIGGGTQHERHGSILQINDDFIIAALNGLPQEYDMIKTVLIARDTPISFKDFRAQLLAAEQTAEAKIITHFAMFTPHSISNASNAPASMGYDGASSYFVHSGQGLLATSVQGPIGYLGGAP
ncbi:unnamed protein product [Prunus armeniaca]